MWFHQSDWNRISCWNDYEIPNRSLPNKCLSLFNVQLLFSIMGQQTQLSLFSLPFSLLVFTSTSLSLNRRNYSQSSSMLKNIIIVLALYNLATIFSTTNTVYAVYNSPSFFQFIGSKQNDNYNNSIVPIIDNYDNDGIKDNINKASLDSKIVVEDDILVPIYRYKRQQYPYHPQSQHPGYQQHPQYQQQHPQYQQQHPQYQQSQYQQPPQYHQQHPHYQEHQRSQPTQSDHDRLSENVTLGYGTNQADQGPWGPWTELSECTKSCGGGVYHQTRTCLDHRRSCIGPTRRYFSCNIQECPENIEDFRSNQCSRFNPIPFDGRYYNWVPYYKAGKPCELNCKPETERFYYRHSRKVIDGTRCYDDDSNNVCVDGVCVELGCDRVLGSTVKEDNCRVCGGDGSTCRTISGVYEQNQGLRTGYADMLYIPAGSTNIKIEEVRPTNNYLAIRNQKGKPHLNGKYRIQPPGTYNIAGTKFHYERPQGRKDARVNFPEKLRALGPIDEPLFIQLLYQEPNQGVSYEYSIPLTQDSASDPNSILSSVSSDSGARKKGMPRYVWIFGDFSECSKTCGNGVQRRNVYCASMNPKTGRQENAPDSLCDSSKRPPDTRTCHNEPCSAQWKHDDWSECSCLHQVQYRNVYCSSGDSSKCQLESGESSILDDKECLMNNQTRPSSIQKCQPDLENCSYWTTTDWTKCDAHCGVGKQTRKVRCSKGSKINKPAALSSSEASTESSDKIFTEASTTMTTVDESTKESATQMASTTMNSLKDSITTTVSSKLNDNVLQPAKREANPETSTIKCEEEEEMFVDDSLCDSNLKPLEEQSCSIRPCEDLGLVEWVTSAWSSCDTDCGSQTQTRQVACVSRDGLVFPDDVCVKLRGERPPDIQECSDGSTCSKSLWFTSEWSQCSVDCGKGLQSRHVFCGHLDEKGLIVKDEDDSKCLLDTKPSNSAVCEQDQCTEGKWFSGPAGPCNVPCGGGTKKRQQFCLSIGNDTSELVTSDNCPETDPISEQCNVEACDENQLEMMVECKNSEFGCCPNDGATPAEENYLNCPQVTADSLESCLKSEFGCCPIDEDNKEDNLTLAIGPYGLGCPVRCANTQFGCCPDMITVANSSDFSSCPLMFEETTTMTTTTMEPTSTTTMMPTTTEMDTTTTTMATTIITDATSDSKLSTIAANCSEDDLLCISTTPSGLVKDCSKSKFGCCPDGWNEAQGPNGEGCEEGSGDISFISSTIASVMKLFTGVTESTPEVSTYSLDCNLTEFGCCPNGKTQATGPRYYGCTCHDYPFGCCQDGFSPASGENMEGCFCERMLFGCCSDHQTPATGPNQEGCSCESSPYGCCSDMRTFAKGPNYAGCPCDTLTFGCCPGSQVPARGPDFAGCSCADTPFGCCADGVTVAYGPKFEGCPSGLPLDTKLNSEVCKLPKETGSCSEFAIMWFFDNEFGTCNRFWYGGCQGNGNRFTSQEQCERACVKPEGPERCLLPMISGPCNSSSEAYYYNSDTKRCERFLYGGCMGNTNRFETFDQCVQVCIYQETALDQCDQPPAPGPCRGSYPRWYYNREEGQCKEFAYGGCHGNLNNFQTEDECQSACASRSPFEICMLPEAKGSCLGSFPRWYFDSHRGQCHEFTYSGCGGNKNRFVDRISCEQLCNQTLSDYYPTDLRQQQHPYGQQYPYHSSDHENRIDPASSFESVCALPQAHGPCRENIIQWYFDVTTRRCERFYYGGCGGNENRFNDREQCEHKCLAYAEQTSTQDPCLEPKDLGDPQCQDYRHRWYYDVEDRRCHRFYYFGCGGNRNNFESDEECTAKCVWPRERNGEHDTRPSASPDSGQSMASIEEFKQENCFKQIESGQCEKNHIQWYYDSRDGVCKEFIYGGCGGNENRFHSQQECQTKCWNSQDICKLQPIRGSCSANFTQWYYDHQNNECYEFQFSGCYGNANRFSSKDSCEQQCKIEANNISVLDQQQQPKNVHQQHQQPQYPTQTGHLPEKCRQPRDPGPCRGYFTQYYFSVEDNECQMFIYGGCGGNENRFNRMEECEQTCSQNLLTDHAEEPREGIDRPEVVCFLKMEPGPCKETQAKWWYDPDSHTCFPFVYGGCQGNKNRFQDFDQCIRFCYGVSHGGQMTNIYSSVSTSETPIQQPYPYAPPPISIPSSQNDHCEPVECHEENCILGIDYYRDERGCPTCRCINPCNNIRCSEDMSCSVELFRDEITGKIQANAECRLRVKPGQCPDNVHYLTEIERTNSVECFDQCRTDADCRNSDKCCNNGCAYVCTLPELSSHGQPSYSGHDDYNKSYSSSMPTPTGQPGNYYNVNDQNYIPPYGEEAFDMNSHQPNYSSYNYQQPSDMTKPNLIYPDSYKYNKSSNDIYNPQQQHRLQQSLNHNRDNMHSTQNGKDSSPEHQPNYYSHYPYNQQGQPYPQTHTSQQENKDLKPIEEDYSNINNYEMTNEIPIEPYEHSNQGENQQQHQSSYPYNTNGQSNHHPNQQQPIVHLQDNQSHHYDSNQLLPHYQQNQHPHQQQSHPDSNRHQHSHQESLPQDTDKQPTNPQNQHSHQQLHPELNSPNQYHQNHQQNPGGNSYQQPNQQDEQQQNQPSDSSRPREYPSVSANIGDEMAFIECPLGKENINNHEHPETFWYKDGKNIESDRYKVLSNGTLQIKNIEPGDHGMFGCMQRNNDRRQSLDGTTNENHYPQVAYIPFEVNESARILPSPNRVIGQPGMAAYLPCNAAGHPRPKVNWWHDNRMLEVNSHKYQQMPNYTLVVHQMNENDVGHYTCHAYNGIDDNANPTQQRHDVELVLMDNNKNVDDEELEIVPYDASMFHNHNTNNMNEIYNNANNNNNNNNNNDYAQNESKLHYPNNNIHRDINNNNFGLNDPVMDPDPINAEIEYWPKDYRIGSMVHLDCLVRNQRTGQLITNANVVWYIDSDIPLLVDQSNRHHYMILPNNTLIVYHLTRSDSGEYRCRANIGPQTDAFAAVKLQIENIDIPADCQDNPIFLNCAMIVENNYCRNPHYYKFCCRSCYIAEHNERESIHLQNHSQQTPAQQQYPTSTNEIK